ncbi:MAG: PEP-CTERM sorting domain-containing protein [Colwellia sp.]|nr:PEP-CTERM sorting domain-containing protein [Colwellia sp.]
MKLLKSLVLAASLLISHVSSASLMLWLDPDVQPGVTGDDVTLTLMAGGLGDGVPLSLGAFDLDILFDSSVLSLTSYSLFDDLGLLGVDAIDVSAGPVLPGVFGLAEISLLPLFGLGDELDLFQPGEFALAELMFHVDALEAPGFTIVSMEGLAFSDAAGLDIVDVEMRSALIGTPPDTTVPEPSTLALLCLGMFFVAYRRKLKIK